jgi:arylsulfatase A-like enzyme
MTRRAAWFPLAAAAAAFLFGAFYFAPATLYLFNAGEVTTPLAEVIRSSGLAQLGALACIAIAGFLGRARGRPLLAAVLLALTALLYLQGNVFVRDYGKFDGSDIDWSRHRLAGVLEVVAWLGVLGVAVAARRRVWKMAPAAALVITLLGGASLGGHLLSGRTFKHATASGLDDRFAEFSRDRNVLIVVLDAFASPVFEQMLIDDPQWRGRLDGFTWYRDALAAYPTTLPSIPAILSGRTTDNSRPVKEFLRDSLTQSSLPVVLQQQGFATCTITEPIYGEYLANVPCTGTVSFLDALPQNRSRRDALLIWNVTMFRYVPHYLKMHVSDDHHWLLREGSKAATSLPYAATEPYCAPSPNQQAGRILQQQLLAAATATSRRPTFKFLHFFTTHLPYFLAADGAQLTQQQAAAMTEAQAVGPQSRAALAQVMEILDRLDALGLREQTLVIVTGDHGSHLDLIPGVDEAAKAAGRPAPTKALPLLLVRPLRATGALKVSEAPVSLTDIPATVAQAMGIAPSFPGRPLHEVPETEPRVRIYDDYTWKHDFWWEEYLPAMTEYRVDGAARNPASWGAGRALPTGGVAGANTATSSSN